MEPTMTTPSTIRLAVLSMTSPFADAVLHLAGRQPLTVTPLACVERNLPEKADIRCRPGNSQAPPGRSRRAARDLTAGPQPVDGLTAGLAIRLRPVRDLTAATGESRRIGLGRC